jgi:fructose-1,6-bisphosphatase
LEDFLQPGTEQIAAGYIIYGSSTMLVYTLGSEVHGFTLDPGLGEFILSHPGIQTPRRGAIFSINMGNCERFADGLKRYLRYLASEQNHHGKPYSLRYIGSLVADFHRNLLHGGIFMYPGDAKSRDGKLRLLYEANPLGLIVERAGGRASVPKAWSSRTAALDFSLFRPATTTRAPALARPRAIPNPMPPFPPVTIATLPLRSNTSCPPVAKPR